MNFMLPILLQNWQPIYVWIVTFETTRQHYNCLTTKEKSQYKVKRNIRFLNQIICKNHL